MSAPSTLDLARDLDERIKAIEARQRAASTAAGKKADQLYRMQERLKQLDEQRAQKLHELREAQKKEAAAESAQPSTAAAVQGQTHRPAVRAAATAAASALSNTPASGVVDVASTSTDARAPRMPRILLGVCMPYFMGRENVRRTVLAVHEKVCAFADVRLVLTSEVIKLAGMESLADEAKAQSRRGRRVADGGAETMCFTVSDQRTSPYEAASELARWADVLLIAPLCTATLGNICSGREDDLLLEIVQSWGTVKKRSPSTGTTQWLPLKPFIVAPRLPAERRNQLIIEKQMEVLEQMGVAVMEDPGEEVRAEGGQERYIAHVVEHVRHAILKAQGLLQLQPRPAQMSASAKRRRNAA